MNVLFSTEVALAKAVRDGATIKGQIIDFQVARRRPCSRCLSLDHRFCGAEPICNWCYSDTHLRAECKAEEPLCIYCRQAHTSRKCPTLKNMQFELQQQDTERLLALIPSFRDMKNAAREDVPVVHLPPRQVRMCQRQQIQPADFAKRSFADVVSSKKKRRRNPEKTHRKKRIDRQRKRKETEEERKSTKHQQIQASSNRY